jgi:hypothetical protein
MHEHRHGDQGKLEAGLPYLLTHNRDHVEDIRKWIQRAEEAHHHDIADHLRKVLDLSGQISSHLEDAVNCLSSDE